MEAKWFRIKNTFGIKKKSSLNQTESVRLSFINLCLCWHVECAHIRICCIRLSVFDFMFLSVFIVFTSSKAFVVLLLNCFLLCAPCFLRFIFLISRWSLWYYQMFRCSNRYLRTFAPLIIIHDLRIDSIHLIWFCFLSSSLFLL